jgi:hypothetical protein
MVAETDKDAFAHCDTLDGPVVGDARLALEKGDVTGLLKWVRKEREQETFRLTILDPSTLLRTYALLQFIIDP